MAEKSTKSAKSAARRKAVAAKAAKARVAARKIRGDGPSFTTFVRQQGVVGLAVGLAIGTSAGAAVKSIVDNFINPIVGFLVGGVSLEALKWETGLTNNANKELVFGWGAIISAIITLVATAFVIYQLIHIAKLDRLDKKKDA